MNMQHGSVWNVSGEAEIQIRVTDMNDNAPFFSERVYTARVPENTDIGTIVMTVTANDRDEGLSVLEIPFSYVDDPWVVLGF